jgi:hypothetical protein
MTFMQHLFNRFANANVIVPSYPTGSDHRAQKTRLAHVQQLQVAFCAGKRCGVEWIAPTRSACAASEDRDQAVPIDIDQVLEESINIAHTTPAIMVA